jgi:hypothetical protein
MIITLKATAGGYLLPLFYFGVDIVAETGAGIARIQVRTSGPNRARAKLVHPIRRRRPLSAGRIIQSFDRVLVHSAESFFVTFFDLAQR